MDTDNSVELNDPAGTVAPGEDCRHEGLPTPRRYLALAGVWLALIVSILDSSIANVALPTIARDLGASPADSIAIVSAFQLGVVISLLPMSALGEIITYRRVFIGGLFIFTLASLGCVTSHDLTELVVARAIQGIGGAGIMSVNGALARFMYPPRLLGAALGANALIIAAFGALGPTIASVMLALGPCYR
jgi:DHA2 family multidrug resistance protein-like MFS transporter